MPINYLKQIQLGEFNENGYRIIPPDDVASIIEGFYVFSRDSQDNSQLIFNDGYPVLVFLQNIEHTVNVTSECNSFEIKAAWASAGSVKNVYVKYSQNTQQVFVVRFHPGAFYRLFNLDAPYFRKSPVAAFDSIAKNNDFNLRDFYKCDSVKHKISFITKYVHSALKQSSPPSVLHQTLEYIHKIKGNSTVRALSDDAGVNYKWLERSFVKNIGLLPKEYIQLQRFIHAYLELVGTESVDLMRVAVSNGYYDANHFLKDFKSYTGRTPMEYLRSYS